METFMFASTLSLRYLKIYSVNHSADDLFICLKLEILGCGIAGTGLVTTIYTDNKQYTLKRK